MDDMEEQFRMAEEQREKLRKTCEEVRSQASSVMKVTLDWRLLLDRFNSLENSLREQTKKVERWSEWLEIKSEMVEERFSQVEKRERQSEVVHKQIKDRTLKLKLIELQLDVGKNEAEVLDKKLEDCSRELDGKEKRLEFLQKSTEECSAELLRIQDSVKECSGNLKTETGCLVSIKAQVQHQTRQLEAVERQYEDMQKLVQQKTKQLEDRSRELDGKEKRLEFLQKSAEECSAELLRIQDSIKECSGNLKTKTDCLDSIKAQVQQQTEQLEAVEKQYEDMQKSVTVLSAKVKSKEKDLQSIEKQVEGVKLLNQQCETELEERRQKLNSLKQMELMPDRSAFTSSANVQSTAATDDTSLASIISHGVHNIWSMKSQVSQIDLGLDPAKMALNLLTHGGFSADGIRPRCLFMERLMQMSPRVSPDVKQQSVSMAFHWKSCFTPEDENPMEVLPFLLFLIVYGVASYFNEKDILDLVMIIAQHKRAPEICRKLGLTQRMPEFIRMLIKKKKHMEAAKFICSFSLAKEFPTEPLLKRYLEKRRMEAWTSRCELNSLEDVDWFMDREVETLRAISSFIKEFKLDDFGSVVQRIDEEMVKLEYDRASRMHSVSHHEQRQNYHPGFTNTHANPQRFQPQLQPHLPQHQKRPRMSAYSDQRVVFQDSSQANRYIDPASGTPANYWQSSGYVIPGNSSRLPNRNTGAPQFHDP